jgi:C1A family cysteine protease
MPITKNRRLTGWKPQPKDHRDHVYQVHQGVVRDLPEAVDLRDRFPVPAWDQGSIGSCGPHSAAADLLYDQVQSPGADKMPSRHFIYYVTRLLMGTVNEDSGVYNRDMAKAIGMYGWCDERLCPYVPSKFTRKPTKQAFSDAAKRRNRTRYAFVNVDLDDMRGCLAQGDPFILGFSVYSNYWEAEETGEWPMPDGYLAGGHDVLAVGYDDSRRAIIIRNSWGDSWGDEGYGYLPYDYASSPVLCGDYMTLHFD